ncbi:MAG: oxidoreductase FAD/NAD(P)-binding domain protein [Proteobacteria bacterium]|nr:oxidoreductase FAD/NAD(P)-binding domain protein [Pseudomonadota bacterium]
MSSQPTRSDETELHRATLVRSERITSPDSAEDVRHLVFRTSDVSFQSRTGQSIRVMAPGQYGNPYHARYYSIAEPEQEGEGSTEFALCVRRCSYIDDFSGEEYKGVASNYLCDLRPGESISFAGPVGLMFQVPENRDAGILMIGMGTGIAPFRAFIRHIYEKVGGWKGKVRLYYGARSGLEMLYMNDENNDLANYYDQETFKAFQAVSPRPSFDAPVALDKALEQNAAEVWDMVRDPATHVFVAGMRAMLDMVEKALVRIAGSEEEWNRTKTGLVSCGRWSEILY